MSVTGLCQICERREATRRCVNCGTLACDAHFDPERGVCVDCSATADPRKEETDVYRF